MNALSHSRRSETKEADAVHGGLRFRPQGRAADPGTRILSDDDLKKTEAEARKTANSYSDNFGPSRRVKLGGEINRSEGR
jgi:hypothetical protein